MDDYLDELDEVEDVNVEDLSNEDFDNLNDYFTANHDFDY